MTNETYGIESLKSAVEVGISFATQAAKTVKGKFKLLHVLAFIDEARLLAEVVADREMVIKEFKDLSETERQQLIVHVQENFELPDDEIESFVEYSLVWANATVTLFQKAKDLRK